MKLKLLNEPSHLLSETITTSSDLFHPHLWRCADAMQVIFNISNEVKLLWELVSSLICDTCGDSWLQFLYVILVVIFPDETLAQKMMLLLTELYLTVHQVTSVIVYKNLMTFLFHMSVDRLWMHQVWVNLPVWWLGPRLQSFGKEWSQCVFKLVIGGD